LLKAEDKRTIYNTYKELWMCSAMQQYRTHNKHHTDAHFLGKPGFTCLILICASSREYAYTLTLFHRSRI